MFETKRSWIQTKYMLVIILILGLLLPVVFGVVISQGFLSQNVLELSESMN